MSMKEKINITELLMIWRNRIYFSIEREFGDIEIDFWCKKSVLDELFISYLCDIMCKTRAVIQSQWEISGNFFLGTKPTVVVGDPYPVMPLVGGQGGL